MSGTSAAAPSTVGYAGLLNLAEDHHVTVFLSDFPLPGPTRRRLVSACAGLSTNVHFCRLNNIFASRAELTASGVDPSRNYLSLHVISHTEAGLEVANELFSSLPRGDLARLELPWTAAGFSLARTEALLKVVREADYGEQSLVAHRFFSLLEESIPYKVVVRSGDAAAHLEIVDAAGWFDLGGPLSPGESRILPGGEVAYVGEQINGTFCVDGAILASAQREAAAAQAQPLVSIGQHLHRQPITFEVEAGKVVGVQTSNPMAAPLLALLEQEAFRAVTEVGVSFNRACHTFIHDWPAASNEGHPGVHIALGGDPDPEMDKAAAMALIHIDLMAATSEVTVNGRQFLRTRQ